jgi:hypothetical protein
VPSAGTAVSLTWGRPFVNVRQRPVGRLASSV